jgi:aryl-alcohol dehydrogenase-like predicted oxidoreductase
MAAGKRSAERLLVIAADWGVPASHLAFAYAFAHPHLASIVFGASSPEQLRENVAAWETFTTLTDDQLDIVRSLETTP